MFVHVLDDTGKAAASAPAPTDVTWIQSKLTFLIVNFCAADVAPSATSPKAKDEGVMVMLAGAPVPVPLSEAKAGLGASLLTLSIPERAPGPPRGAKRILTQQDAPGARSAPVHVFAPTGKVAASAPVPAEVTWTGFGGSRS